MQGFLFSPYGRISRRTYWLHWILPYIGLAAVATMLDYALFPIRRQSDNPLPLFEGALGLISFWPAIALATKRLHDVGMTGWWNTTGVVVALLFSILTYSYYVNELSGGAPMPTELADPNDVTLTEDMILMAGAVILAWLLLYPLTKMFFFRGQAGANKYGPDPMGNRADVFQ
ncbi:MAG: DUF805 domain-containing protein [Alphaproteobacteria bacterium]|nr:DUF805 domain-containing protein [Alphaproteobacteria bacterium]